MEIFKLFGSIMVNSSEAEKSISNTGSKAEGLAAIQIQKRIGAI